MSLDVFIGKTKVGPDSPPYLVSEISGNHQQDIKKAKALIRASAKAGAHAVKFQTYTPDTLTLPAKTEYFRKKDGLWKDRYLYDLYKEGMTPWEWFPELNKYAQECGMTFFSTPFDESSVDFLEESINPPVYKIASYELVHVPLLKKVGMTQKPVILSTGMGSEAEITRAVKTLKESGTNQIILLKCISSYPANPKDFNLKSILTLQEKYNVPVGLSDHTLTNEICLGAVALGACFIEKHVIQKRTNGAIDAGFSLEPQEFAQMAKEVNLLYSALGSANIAPSKQETMELTQRRSIFISKPIPKGSTLTPENIKIIRPAAGLCPSKWEEVLGKVASEDLRAGEPLKPGNWA